MSLLFTAVTYCLVASYVFYNITCTYCGKEYVLWHLSWNFAHDYFPLQHCTDLHNTYIKNTINTD